MCLIIQSILLISRLPVEELSGKRIALTTTSATSHVLLKLILARGYGVEPEYSAAYPDVDKMLADADAALLIGDIALKHYIDPQDLFRYDLGAEWKKLTGKRMVYAVWAVSRKFAETESASSWNVFEIFKKSMDYSMEHLGEIAEYAAKWEPFSSSFLREYFRSLRFDFGKEYQEGLLHFYKLAAEGGLLETVPSLEFLQSPPGGAVQ